MSPWAVPIWIVVVAMGSCNPAPPARGVGCALARPLVLSPQMMAAANDADRSQIEYYNLTLRELCPEHFQFVNPHRSFRP